MSGIHLYIKRNLLPEELYLQFMLLLGLFFGYFEVTAFWNAGVILLTGWLLLASKRIQKVVQKNATAVLLLFCLVCLENGKGDWDNEKKDSTSDMVKIYSTGSIGMYCDYSHLLFAGNNI